MATYTPSLNPTTPFWRHSMLSGICLQTSYRCWLKSTAHHQRGKIGVTIQAIWGNWKLSIHIFSMLHMLPTWHVVGGYLCRVLLTCHMTCLTCHQVSPRHVSVRKTFLLRHREMSRNFTMCRDIWWHVTTNVSTCHRCRMSCYMGRVATYQRHLCVSATCRQHVGDMCN
jgi:hypothetical protein